MSPVSSYTIYQTHMQCFVYEMLHYVLFPVICFVSCNGTEADQGHRHHGTESVIHQGMYILLIVGLDLLAW